MNNEAEKITGIKRTCIGSCCRGEHYTAGGYVWEFAEEDKEIEPDVLYKNFEGNKVDIYERLDTKFKVIEYYLRALSDVVNKLSKKGE